MKIMLYNLFWPNLNKQLANEKRTEENLCPHILWKRRIKNESSTGKNQEM